MKQKEKFRESSQNSLALAEGYFKKFYSRDIYKKTRKSSCVKPFIFGVIFGFVFTVILMNIL